MKILFILLLAIYKPMGMLYSNPPQFHLEFDYWKAETFSSRADVDSFLVKNVCDGALLVDLKAGAIIKIHYKDKDIVPFINGEYMLEGDYGEELPVILNLINITMPESPYKDKLLKVINSKKYQNKSDAKNILDEMLKEMSNENSK